MTTNALTSLAILKVNINQGRDYLEYLRPFILHILAEHQTSRITDRFVSEHIREDFGLEIPDRTVQVILKRISKKSYLSRNQGVYEVTGDLPNVRLNSKQREAGDHITSVLNGLVEFSKSQKRSCMTKEQSIAAIMAFLSEFDITCLRAYLRGNTIPNLDKTTRQDVILVSDYVRYIQSKDDKVLESFLVIVQGHMLANALLCPDLQNAPRSYNGVTFYLDTPLLIHILGCDGPARNDAISELVELLLKLGGRVATFSHLRDEAASVIRSVSSDLDSSSPQNQIIIEARKKGMKRADLLLLAEGIDDHLGKVGIEIISTPPSIPDFQIDEQQFGESLDNRVSYRNPNAKMRDIRSVRSIYVLRADKPTESLEKSTAVLVTSNVGFSKAAWEYGQSHESSVNVSSVVTDFSLANMAWLKAPMGALRVPVTQLLAFSYAALRPSAPLLEKYMAEMDRLLEDGTISVRDHQLLRSSPLVYDELMTLTLGEDIALTHETVTEVLGRVSREIRKEESEKLAIERASHDKTKNLLVSQQKLSRKLAEGLYWRCQKRAKKVANMFSVSAVCLLLLGLYVGLELDIRFPWSWIVVVADVVLLSLTVYGLLLGGSVRQVHAKIENRYLSWLLRREARATGVDMGELGIDFSWERD